MAAADRDVEAAPASQDGTTPDEVVQLPTPRDEASPAAGAANAATTVDDEEKALPSASSSPPAAAEKIHEVPKTDSIQQPASSSSPSEKRSLDDAAEPEPVVSLKVWIVAVVRLVTPFFFFPSSLPHKSR